MKEKPTRNNTHAHAQIQAHIHDNRYTPQEVGGTLIGEDRLVVMAGTV
jgi:hypothetical protein